MLEVTGYVPNAAQQPLSALTGIRLVIGPIPAVLLLVGIVFALRYPLSREKHAQVVADLQARRAAQRIRIKRAYDCYKDTRRKRGNWPANCGFGL